LGLARLADLPAAYLSAGQKRRVALARLLVARRPLWLLDEPSTALDHGAQALLGKIMAAHRADGGMIIAATHASLGIEGRELKLGPSA
jgi:heme exporter protein A